ncbi:hypothetical protein V6Z11_A12G308600 [Gossypium hirsutum]
MFLSKQFGCYAFICMLDITIKVIPLIQSGESKVD